MCLASSACLGIGSGLVTAGVPRDLNDIFEIKLTEVMTLPLASQKGVISYKSFGCIKDFIRKRKVNVLALGTGLSNTASTRKLVKSIIKEIKLPIVLDADGINALSQETSILKKAKSKIVITPHLGEFSRLIKKPVDYIKNNRKELAKNFSFRYNLVLVLKGHRTIITDGVRIFENTTGNPGLSTAGSGDVLTGIITGLISQTISRNTQNPHPGLDIYEAARFGVYLHGLAADYAAKDKTQASLIASCIIEYLSSAIRAALR